MKFRECDSINSQENVHAGYRNGSRIMCLQNSPKLWCRYEFIVHNHLGPSKTALEFENCKEELFTLTMCLPTYLWAHIARNPFNYTITAQTLNSCKIWWLSILEIDSLVSSIRKKLTYRKHFHHNPSIKYASRCWAKRKELHVLWDKQFLQVQTNRV